MYYVSRDNCPITNFVINYSDAALVVNLETREIMLRNTKSTEFFSNISHLKYKEFIMQHSDPLIIANLEYCSFIDRLFQEKLTPTFANEIFANKCYSTVRFLISYKKTSCFLFLINERDDKEQLLNNIII
ncbi:hypothetical protein A6E05_02855 [Aliivibrio sp. 1S165]|uniref:hypothetical protein n=1 Tax=unclassified Aliivibrio TaxID=2645654 RepID=UPI00080DACD0|nr:MULTISPECIES: hypothetical protein [unclassified Aliivibrio]OCH16786.1 hypothetical protein A6E05_02855 [Aliivibrio sp. 1S165]OCH32762.1 hypothetical protein A6E06_01610 [Aliivibrio sp. 1S175]